jgi:uncharacterized membrane protein
VSIAFPSESFYANSALAKQNIHSVLYSFRVHRLDSITKRIKQLEDLITDNNASNLLKHVALLTTTIATSSALTAATTSITNQLEANLNTSVHSGKIVSIETLLDSLVILYDECSNSSLRREKTVSDFLELCKLNTRHHCRSIVPPTNARFLALHF